MAMVTLCLSSIFFPTKNVAILSINTANPDTAIDCLLPDTFILKWRHSVEKQYWQEVYELSDDRLILTKTYTQTFGAGVPSTGEPINAPKGYIGQRINQPMPQIQWVVSTNMQGEILAGDDVLSIYKSVPDYSEVLIVPDRLSFWQFYHLDSCFN